VFTLAPRFAWQIVQVQVSAATFDLRNTLLKLEPRRNEEREDSFFKEVFALFAIQSFLECVCKILLFAANGANYRELVKESA
jgi:hypothetical protein